MPLERRKDDRRNLSGYEDMERQYRSKKMKWRRHKLSDFEHMSHDGAASPPFLKLIRCTPT
eukprot:scaffold756_cov158-Amphora_coffeaeformis.AAC.3